MTGAPEIVPHTLTPDQLRARRSRSIAIALILVGLAVMFFVMTIVRLGGNVLDRPY
jgi:hypothetical protein